MTDLDPHQRAAITKRNKTRSAFLGTATDIFSELAYPDIQVMDVVRRSGISSATYYTMFPSKGAWAAAVLDARLNTELDKQQVPEAVPAPTPRARVLGHLVLLGEAAAPLPGVTQALVEERTTGQVSYSELLPRYHGELTGALRHGQEQQAFRANMDAAEMADFALDSLAMTYAVHLDSPAARTMNLPSLVLDGFSAR